MSGKQAKREAKRLKELERQERMRRERRATYITMGIIAAIVLLGGALVWASIDPPEAAEDASEDVADDRPIACGAEEPPGAGVDREPFAEPQGIELDPSSDYQAVLETSCGTVVVDLYEDRAPLAVANFVGLADQGFYDARTIFRNEPSIAILQSGSGDDTNAWQHGYTFEDELQAAEEEGYTAGSLSMANSGPNTNGSQFFLSYGESELPPNYTKFGQVVEGLEVLETIGAIPVEGDRPTERIYIEAVTIRVTEKEQS